MKINFILPSQTMSGGSLCVLKHAEKLNEKGHEVNIFCPSLPRMPLKEKVKKILGRKSTWVQPRFFELGQSVVPLTVLKRRGRINPKDLPDADVLIATWWETFEWVKNAHISKGKLYYFVQGHEVFPNQPIDRVKKTYLENDIDKIVVSDWLRKVMQKEYGSEKLHLVPNGVNEYYLTSLEQEVQKEECSVGFVYSPLECKGPDLAFQAIRMLEFLIPNLKVHIFGLHHPEKNGFQLTKNCTFYQRPSLVEIKKIYHKCSVWMFPSREEGFGLPILESLACGTPVVAFDSGAASMILDKKSKWLVKTQRPEDMAKAIYSIVSVKKEKREKLSKQAKSIAKDWTWEKSSTIMENILLS